jgi:glycosyltransferase involved in cell wall biosynthesis
MNIAIDARWIFKDISGIGNYTRNLLEIYAKDPGHHKYKVLFTDREIADRTIAQTGMDQASHMETAIIPWGIFSPKSQCKLPTYLKQQNIQVFHSPNYMLPFLAFQRKGRGRIRAVTTIHDLIPIRFPDHAPQSRKSRFLPLFKAVLQEAAKRSTRIITVSHASAQDIESFLHVRSSKIDVIYNGVSSSFAAEKEQTGAFRSNREEVKLLYIGRADPYKNIEQLIRVVHHLRTHHNCPATLTLVGAPDPRYPKPQEYAKELGLENEIHWTGFVMDHELIRYINDADVMVHPSRYEGFGLQIIEAMSCGIPVVCSNAGSLPEVAADAAILADPDDTEGFIHGILTLKNNPTERQRFIDTAYENVKRFSWQISARATIASYEKAWSEEEQL